MMTALAVLGTAFALLWWRAGPEWPHSNRYLVIRDDALWLDRFMWFIWNAASLAMLAGLSATWWKLIT